jgi:nucleoside-diphosphate-sugar epimerase
VYGALAGADAVIHLAAIPAPTGHAPEVVFGNNVLSTFNVFEAAATLGVRRVVSASSLAALGFGYQHRWSEPLYVPIDEAHPLLPQDAYGLSKATGEDIAAAYCRRGAGSAASLRFSTILDAHTYGPFIATVKHDPGASARHLWSYVDLRDATRACLLALTVPFEGHMPLFITAGDTTADLPTDLLLERYFPAVPRRPAVPAGGMPNARWSLLDGIRARDVLDYRPQFAWSRVLQDTSSIMEEGA